MGGGGGGEKKTIPSLYDHKALYLSKNIYRAFHSNAVIAALNVLQGIFAPTSVPFSAHMGALQLTRASLQRTDKIPHYLRPSTTITSSVSI